LKLIISPDLFTISKPFLPLTQLEDFIGEFKKIIFDLAPETYHKQVSAYFHL
jgi:hypothetical protein